MNQAENSIQTMEKSTKKSQQNRINEFTISYLFKRLPLELIQIIMHCLPFEHSKALSEGFQGTLSLNPYRFHEPDQGANVLMESVIKRQDITALDGLLANRKFYPSGNWLTIAIDGGHLKSVARLIQDPRVDPSDQVSHAIRWGSGHDRIAIVKMLLQDPRVDPSANDNDAIREASSQGHNEIAKMLLQDPRVDPSANNNEAIRLASREGHIEILRMLLQDPRVDPSDEDNEAIQEASIEGHIEIVEMLIRDPRVDPSSWNNYAIREASSRGHN